MIEIIDDTTEDSSHITVLIFPYEEEQTIEIPSNDGFDPRILRQLIDNSLPDALRDERLRYNAEVILRTTIKAQTIKYNKSYAHAEHSKILTETLNDETRMKEWLNLKGISDAIIHITVEPRDFARRYYNRPDKQLALLDYHIDIYDGRNADTRKLIVEYIERYEKTNSALFTPLHFTTPLTTDQIDDPMTVIFIARDKEMVIGFCACKLLRYRAEIKTDLDKKYKDIFKKSNRAEKYVEEDHYFMGKPLSHIFEIKAISADQNKAGNNIPFALLYCAMDFMHQEKTRQIYPVSHIASQAASYVTKYLLQTKFHFVYHGPNMFMNENLFETLTIESKKSFLAILGEILGYCDILLKSHRTPELQKQLIANTNFISVYRDMIKNIVSLYHLYFMILQTHRRGTDFDCYDQSIINHFVNLFESIIASLPDYNNTNSAIAINASIKKYLTQNRDVLANYNKDLASLATVIYTSDDKKLKEYGFLVRPIKGVKKTLYSEAHIFFVSCMASMVKLTRKMPVKTSNEDDQIAIKHALNLIYRMLLDDVSLMVNYEIPSDQFIPIKNAIETLEMTLRQRPHDFIKAIPEPNNGDVVMKAIDTHHDIVKRKEDINKQLTNDIFNVDPDTTSGFDTFISMAFLSEKWSDITKSFFIKIGFIMDTEPKNIPVEEVCHPPVIISIPKSTEERSKDVRLLNELLLTDNETVVFKEREWPIRDLMEYSISLCNRDDNNNQQTYTLDMFQVTWGDLNDDSLFNNTLI